MQFTIPFINRVSFLDILLFAKHLSLMIKSGLTLRESVATIQEQSKNKKFKKILDDVIKDIDNGQSLTTSLSRHPQAFNALYVNMVRVGEESGTLEENLEHLTVQLEKSRELRGKVQAAMIYPSIVLIAVIGLGAVLNFFVLPKIIPLFQAFNIKLPLITRMLMKFTEIFQNYGLFILFGILAIIAIFVLLYQIRLIKFLIHKVILKLPVAGSISRNVNISHFGRTLGLLFRGGLTVISALDITQATFKNLVYQKELKTIASEVQKGKSISDYLRKKESLFPAMVSRMIEVGEKTGKLEESLLYLGDYYEKEVDKSVKNLSSTIEPILLLIIGAVVGLIALAIISPIYEITRGLRL